MRRGATTRGTVTSGGSWQGVRLESTAGASILSHVIVRGSGASGAPAFSVSGVSPAITDSTFEYGEDGVILNTSNATLLRSTIRKQTSQGHNASGIRIAGGAPTVENNTLSDNFIGLSLLENPSATFRNNTITGSTYRAGILSGLGASVIEGNTNSGVNTSTPPHELMLTDRLTTVGATSTLGVNGIPYAVDLYSANVVAGSGLVVSPGAIVKFGPNAPLDLFGTIQVGGTSATTTFSSLTIGVQGVGILKETGSHGTFTRVEFSGVPTLADF